MQVDRDAYALAGADLPKPSAVAILHTPADLARFEAILLRLQTVIDVAGLWATIQSLLGEAISHDACVLSLSAHDLSKSGCTPKILATSGADNLLKWMRRFNQGQLLPTLLGASPGTKMCQLSDISFDPRNLRHSEFFRRYMAPARWHYVACLLFWEHTDLSAGIAMMRTTKQGAFTDREVALLRRLHPHIEATLDRLFALDNRDRARAVPSLRRTPEFSRSGAEPLTPAEAQLVGLLYAGLSNKEIAHRLHKSVRTVKTQLTSIYRKYRVRSRTRLLAATRGCAGGAFHACLSGLEAPAPSVSGDLYAFRCSLVEPPG
jgi:DNA-binding CsgD family transcriptional regulator